MTHKTHHIVVLMVKVYYIERVTIGSARERDSESGEIYAHVSLCSPSPVKEHIWHVSLSSNKVQQHMQWFCPRKTSNNSAPKFYVGLIT